MAFPYKLPSAVQTIGDDDVQRALSSVAHQLERQGSPRTADNLRQYLQNRKGFVANYEGKYAKISDEGIDVTDMVRLGDNDIGFTNNFNGIMLKIGHELERPTASAMYSKVYSMPTFVYTMPISFGKRDESDKLWISNMEAIIDTGCTVTIFDESVIGWIRGSGYNYSTLPVTVDVVGGKADVQTGRIDLDLCSTPFTGFNVNFANLNGRVALIGTDLLNSGKLDVDSGTKLSFTKH